MDSNSSSYYVTTYSEDERIEKDLREKRRIEKLRASDKDRARQQLFDNYSEADLPIFKLRGIKFHAFRHLKIKFSFHPAAISNFIKKDVKFYISLKYQGKYWKVRRDSLPANCKWKIYSLFYGEKYFTVDDENIFAVIMKIHEALVIWTKKNEEFRTDKYERYKNGEDVELDSDDEELFLTQAEITELWQKRTKVLRRMLPPTSK